MQKYLIIIGTQLLVFATSLGAQQVRVSGFVIDSISRERLIGAYITEQGTQNGSIADNNGYFSIVIKPTSSLKFSFIGYKSYLADYNLKNDTLINILLSSSSEQLSEVVVSAKRPPVPTKFNIATISYKQMVQIPSLGGKPDIIKSLQLLPGISSQNEGSSLMLVRGGDPGQNLYLFDNVPVIYVNHLGGFMSVFNPDIINNIDVFKGGFPSRYGGKLSSVVDITQKEGDNSEIKGSVGIGITDASFTVEGPLKIENTTFILTGRKTLVDPLLALASYLSDGSNYIISYGFHDINGKLTWKPDEKNSFSFNIYQGDDYLNYWSTNSTEKYRFGNVWGNWLVSARWNSMISSKLYISNSISFTRYRLKEFMKYSMTDITDTVKFNSKYESSVQDISYRSAWKYNASKNLTVDFGIQSSLLKFVPNETFLSNLNIQRSFDKINSLESTLYADNKIVFFNTHSAVIGMRVVNYLTKGYSAFSFEPRLNLNFTINSNNILNITYMRVSQFSHLVFTTGSIMNNEVWIPAGKKILPAKSDQYTLGWNGNYFDGKFSSELTLYYKNMYNLSTFKEGYTSLMGDESWASKVESGGKGESVGAEFFIRKNSGKLTGFISYSLSKTTRQYPNINKGQKYLFDYDRPNMLSFNLSYLFNEKLTFNLTWIYQTGLPYTPAIGRQYTPSLEPDDNGNYFYETLIYGDRNSAKMKDYHRLDLGLSYSTLTKKRNNKAIWSFSLYNAYNRRNPVFYYYNTTNTGEIYNPETSKEFKPISLYQLSLFPIIPTLSYKVFFDGNSSKSTSQKGLSKQKSTLKQKIDKWLYYEK